MNLTELDLKKLSASAGLIPENTPVVMLNLVRYREQANYDDLTDFSPCSGREAYYTRYVPAFAQVAASLNRVDQFKPIFLGSVASILVGPAEEPWDDLVLVEYPNFEALRVILESSEYQRNASPHRKAALQNWRFLAMVKQSLP